MVNLSRQLERDLIAFDTPAIIPGNIPAHVFERSLEGYDKCTFIDFMRNRFGSELTSNMIKSYKLGTVTKTNFGKRGEYMEGAVIFWQIDQAGQIRSGKAMKYDPHTGKRIKTPGAINWVHNFTYNQFNLNQCFFGEHLLTPAKPVLIVESEKTALICSVYLSNFTAIASGSLANLNATKCKVLKGYQVALIPDGNGAELWASKASTIHEIQTAGIIDLHYESPGDDIADILLKFDLGTFEIVSPYNVSK